MLVTWAGIAYGGISVHRDLIGLVLPPALGGFCRRPFVWQDTFSTSKNLNNWTVCYVVGPSSSSKVKKFVFSVSEVGKVLCFLPPSREGNPGLHSTPSNYSSVYG